MKNIVIVILIVACGYLGWTLYGTQLQAMIPHSAVATTTVPTRPAVVAPAPAPTKPDAGPLSQRVAVESPTKHAVVTSTFAVSGKAPGGWYFEASFPIQVRDAQDCIGRSHGQAQGEWMTDAQVPFTASMTLEGGYRGAADLILMRDNPSGLPENDDSFTVPIQIQ